MYLAQDSIASIVVASLHRGEHINHYELGAYVVMSNHVHALLLPRISPSRLMQSLNGATAREANRTMGRTGETFWQVESYTIGFEMKRNGFEFRLTSRTIPSRQAWWRGRRNLWSSAAERQNSGETSLGAADTSV
jgi:REP element-mobilizing transposase RayT